MDTQLSIPHFRILVVPTFNEAENILSIPHFRILILRKHDSGKRKALSIPHFRIPGAAGASGLGRGIFQFLILGYACNLTYPHG